LEVKQNNKKIRQSGSINTVTGFESWQRQEFLLLATMSRLGWCSISVLDFWATNCL